MKKLLLTLFSIGMIGVVGCGKKHPTNMECVESFNDSVFSDHMVWVDSKYMFLDYTRNKNQKEIAQQGHRMLLRTFRELQNKGYTFTKNFQSKGCPDTYGVVLFDDINHQIYIGVSTTPETDLYVYNLDGSCIRSGLNTR